MKQTFLCITALFCAVSLFAEKPVERNVKLIDEPVVNIYVQPDNKGPINSQVLYGHEVEVIEVTEVLSIKWRKVRTPDGVEGYCETDAYLPDKVLWRTSGDLQRVKSLVGCIYQKPDTKLPTVLRLPYNAYLKILSYSQDKQWAQVEMINGSTGWIMSGDIEPITKLSTQEAIERIQQFIGLPYIWGGNSSFGYDCSGLTQTIARQMGYPMKRNSRAQSQDKGLLDVAYEDIQPGDFIYLNGIIAQQTGYYGVNHVALCIGGKSNDTRGDNGWKTTSYDHSNRSSKSYV